MKLIHSKTCWIFIVLPLMIGFMPAGANDLDWGLTYLVETTESGPLSINCAADGKFYMIYVDETEDQLESAVFYQNSIDN
nr:hypothetical protein [bacterium]